MPDEVQQGAPVSPSLPKIGESVDPVAGKPLTEADVTRITAAEIERRRRQSEKDRQRSAKARLLDDVDPAQLAAAVKAAGGDVEVGLRNLKLDRLIAPTPETDDETTPAPAPGRAAPEEDRAGLLAATTDILNGAGIAATDPEYLAMAGKNFPSESAFLRELSSWAVKRARSGAPASAAAGATAGGGGVPGAADKETNREKLTTRLQTLMKNPTMNQTEIEKVRAELIGNL